MSWSSMSDDSQDLTGEGVALSPPVAAIECRCCFARSSCGVPVRCPVVIRQLYDDVRLQPYFFDEAVVGR